MNSLIKIFKIASKFQKYADEHTQSWQPGDYAKALKSSLGIKRDDSVDLNSPPVNAIYAVIEKHGFSGELKVTLGISADKQASLNVSFYGSTPKKAKAITSDIQSSLLPSINDKLKSLPAPLTDYPNICSVDISAF